jgi:hypothetical protein
MNAFNLFRSLSENYRDEIIFMDLAREEWKDHIKKEWIESRNLPRKRKKQKRKELQLDWNFANYDILSP